jgi:hypothetical protein
MEPHTVPNDTSHELADDMLRGADEIAEFIFGERGSRRKMNHLAECTKLPVFGLGSVLCARRSGLLSWIAGQENRVTRHSSLRARFNYKICVPRPMWFLPQLPRETVKAAFLPS